jgi:hypothetical protein
MSNPVQLSTIVPPRQQLEEEKDRYKLTAGIRFVITDIHLQPSQNYGTIGKINGYDLITKQPLKYRTTSKYVIPQLEVILKNVPHDEHGHLTQEIKVFVGEVKGKGGTGIELQDAA